MKTNFFAVFYTNHLYYLPQYLPIAKELSKRGLLYKFIICESGKRDIFDQNLKIKEICDKEEIPYQLGEDSLCDISTEYLICGANEYPDTLLDYKKSVLVVHGVGTKKGYFTDEKNKYDIRFVEGDFRYDTLKTMYPNSNTLLENVGFSKLDGVFAYSKEDKELLFSTYKLDVNKKTLLYAPTFYPSSIENMSEAFPADFSNYNVIIKPHYFSFLRKKYKKQRRLFEIWAKYPNVYIAGYDDYNLVPFFAISDLMISDESSAIFEFAALGKPVICNKFIKLRWTYRLFKGKFRKRMDSEMDKFRDIGQDVDKYSDLKSVVEYELSNINHKQAIREKYTKQIIGLVDGKVSHRIVDVLEREI